MNRATRAGIAAALACALVGAGGPALALIPGDPAVDGAVDVAAAAAHGADTALRVADGELSWGVHSALRRHLETDRHARSGFAAFGGARYAAGDAQAVFPVHSGSVDPAAGAATIVFDGGLDIRGPRASWLRFDTLRLEAAGGHAQLIGDTTDATGDTAAVVLADFTVPERFPSDGEFVSVEGSDAQLSTAMLGDHLARAGGRAARLAQQAADGFTLSLRLQTGDSVAATPAPVRGEAYSGSSAVLQVSPGANLNPAGATEVTVTGTGFVSGTAVHLGFGVMRDPSQPEAWRPSAGGTAGEAETDAFTIGLPQVIPGSAVTDGEWSAKIVLPGPALRATGGGEINCRVAQCGFFAYADPQAPNAQHEAYVAVTFADQPAPAAPAQHPEIPKVTGQPDLVGDEPTKIPNPQDKPEPFGEGRAVNPGGATVVATPVFSLKDSEQIVKVTGTGFPTTTRAGTVFGGVYVLFGWIDEGKWRPSQGGASGVDYTYAPDVEENGNPTGTYQRFINFPGNQTAPDQPFMDTNGNWEVDLRIKSSQFVSAHDRKIDCYQVQCGIITIGAHGQRHPDSELFVPVYFTATAEETGNQAPAPTERPAPVANPNFNLPATPAGAATAAMRQTVSALAKTGASARTVAIGAAFTTSLGLLALALYALRRRTTALPPLTTHRHNQ